MARITLLSTSDADLLSALSSDAEYALGNLSRLDVDIDLPCLLEGAKFVIVRLLDSVPSSNNCLGAVLSHGSPVVVLGSGEMLDMQRMSHSTVPIDIAAKAHTYLTQGGPANLAHLHVFLSDAVLRVEQTREPLPTQPNHDGHFFAATDEGLPSEEILT